MNKPYELTILADDNLTEDEVVAHIKDLLGKQKEFSGKLNECIKTSLANIIATKTNYKNELIKIQDNIKYDSVNDNENKNLMKQISDISKKRKCIF